MRAIKKASDYYKICIMAYEKRPLHKALGVARSVFAASAIFFVVYYLYSSGSSAGSLFIGELFWFLAMGLTAVMIYEQINRGSKRTEKETIELALLTAFLGVAFAFIVLYMVLQ